MRKEVKGANMRQSRLTSNHCLMNVAYMFSLGLEGGEDRGGEDTMAFLLEIISRGSQHISNIISWQIIEGIGHNGLLEALPMLLHASLKKDVLLKQRC